MTTTDRRPGTDAPAARLVVGPVRPEEAEGVGQVCVAAYRAAHLFHDPEEGYAATLLDVTHRSERAQVLVARAGGAVVGTVTLARAGTPYADIARAGEVELRMLAVLPEAQGGGVGSALLAEAARWAGAAGATALVLSVLSADGPGAPHRLYEGAGFRRVPERDYVGAWDPAAVMWFYRLPLAGVTGADRGA